MRIPFSYLDRQFGNSPLDQYSNWHYTDRIFNALKNFVKTEDFTLGKKLEEFERRFAEFIGVKHAIGVGSGTDALMLSLKALGIESGDEVITSAETFIATVGAIVATGARSVFVDVNDEFVIDASKIAAVVSKKTKKPLHKPFYFTTIFIVSRDRVFC